MSRQRRRRRRAVQHAHNQGARHKTDRPVQRAARHALSEVGAGHQHQSRAGGNGHNRGVSGAGRGGRDVLVLKRGIGTRSIRVRARNAREASRAGRDPQRKHGPRKRRRGERNKNLRANQNIAEQRRRGRGGPGGVHIRVREHGCGAQRQGDTSGRGGMRGAHAGERRRGRGAAAHRGHAPERASQGIEIRRRRCVVRENHGGAAEGGAGGRRRRHGAGR